MAGCGDSGEWRKQKKSAKRNNDPAREERVLNILKEMEASIVRDETEAQTILSNLQLGLEAMAKNGKKEKISNVKRKECVSTAISDSENNGSKGKRPSTHTPSSNRSDAFASLCKYKPPTCQVEENVPRSIPSQTSLGSSKVQQLRLFWDKFFLTETITEREESNELLDKARFISEAKTEMLDEDVLKKKQTRKISITPSRAPMSFRLVPSKQNRKRRVQTEHRFSDLELILSREVSTCVAKVPVTPSQHSDVTSSSTRSLSVKSEQKEQTLEESKEDSVQEDRLKLYKLLLAVEASGNKFVLNRRMGYSKNVGLKKIIKMEQLLHSYTEGVSITKEEANFIDPSVLMISQVDEKRTRPRKYCTLLPCYYVTVDEPVLSLAGGDFIHLDDKLSSESLNKPENIKDRLKRNYERKGGVSIEYERFVYTTYTNVSQENSDSNKWRSSQYLIFTSFIVFLIAAMICYLTSVSHNHFLERKLD